MSSKLILEQTLTDIADAIRSKAGTTDPINPADMPQAIEDLPSGGGDTINDVLLEKTQTEYVNNTFEGVVPASLFSNNDKLKLVEFQKVKFAGSSICYYCTALETVNFPKLTRIEQSAFSSCIALKTVEFPEAVNIYGSAFQNCTALKSVSLPKCLSTSNGGYIFYGCTSLENVHVPLLGTVNEDMFGGCTSLQEFEGESVVAFGYRVFLGCTNLKLVDIGREIAKGKTTTPQTIFGGFNNTPLKALVLRNPNGMHPLGTSGAFSGTPIANGTGYIYVPRALVSTYQAGTNWSTLSSQIRAVEDYTQDGTLTGDFIMPS